MRIPGLTLGLLALLSAITAKELSAAPTIFQVTDPVGPGEAVTVLGDDLGADSRVEVGRADDANLGRPPTSGAVSPSPPARMQKAEVLQPCDQSLKFIVPDSLKRGVFVYRLTTGEGEVLGALNVPAVWWVQGDLGAAASPGGWLRLFGKNLGWASDGGKEPATTVLLAGRKTVHLTAKANCFAARVQLPDDLPRGSYRVFVHNGCGGPVAWSEGVEVTVAAPPSWPSTVLKVTDFGADSSGRQDSTAAISAALARAAEAGGGVLYFPRGCYQLTAGLTVPRFTILRGEGRELVSLFWPDLDDPPEALIQGTNSFALEDLTLYATRHKHIIVSDLGSTADAGNVRLLRLRVRANAYRGHLTPEEVDARFQATRRLVGGDTIRLGGDNVEVADCDFYGSGRALYFSRVRKGYVHDNTFYNGRWGWYCISGSDGLIFENNRIVGGDLMSTGGGLNCLDGSSCSQNVYYAGNTLSLMHGWDREAMTSDAGGGLYYGGIVSCDGVRLTLKEAPNAQGRNWVGAGVFIFDGRGWAQYRRVVAVEGPVVTVDRPWDVVPDSTSLVGITMLQRHYILLGNSFSDAGIAVQFYGSSVEHIVAGNQCARAGGYQAIGKAYGGYNLPPDKNPCHQPSWFCQFIDNKIEEGNIYRGGANNAILSGDSVVGVYGWPLTRDWPWPYNVGAVVRRNWLTNNARVHVGGSSNEKASVRDVIVENNVVSLGAAGIQIDQATTGVLVRGNRFQNVAEPLTGSGVEKAWIPAEQLAEAEASRLRVALAQAGLEEDPTGWPDVAAALGRLRAARSGSAEARAAVEEATEAALLGIAARKTAVPLSALDSLLGLELVVAKESTLPRVLQEGDGGEAQLVLSVKMVRSRPSWTVRAEVTVPEGWQVGEAGPPLVVEPGTQGTLGVPMVVPARAWGVREMPVALVLGLRDDASLRLTTRITVGSSFLRRWMVLGPFANKTGAALDLTLLPPDEGVDLKAQYDGRDGRIGWRPVNLSGDWCDLNALFGAKGAGTAYAVACVEAEKACEAVLRVGSSGGIAVTVNGLYLWAAQGSDKPMPGQWQVPVSLRAGDNVFLFKLSTATDQWRFVAELSPPTGGFPGRVTVVKPEDFAGRAVFVPPAPTPQPAVGELRHTAGVQWQLVHGDDFDRTTLGGRWRVARGAWQCAGGLLIGSGSGGFLAYAEKVSAPVRIEYDTRIMKGDSAGDLSSFWLADPTNYGSGYLLGFGSNGNTLNKVMIDGEQVATGERPLPQPGKWHHVIAQILTDGRVQLIVDDQLALAYTGKSPGEPKYPGLWVWGPDGVFAKVRIYTGAPQ